MKTLSLECPSVAGRRCLDLEPRVVASSQSAGVAEVSPFYSFEVKPLRTRVHRATGCMTTSIMFSWKNLKEICPHMSIVPPDRGNTGRLVMTCAKSAKSLFTSANDSRTVLHNMSLMM
ncbi:hypothetical protein Bbelb_291050 [Branchiostoma belcheri]|nr:hypothetical protein Bbelb_291050 [Branchiostoma belcheri]